MQGWIDIPLGVKSYQPRSRTQSIERLVNLYAEPGEPGGKKSVVLVGDPGLTLWTTVGGGPIRGLHRAHGYVWTVSGTSLYAIDEGTKVALLVGTIDGVRPVRMIHNATHVSIVGDNYLYAATPTSLATVANVSGLISSCYQDGYGIFVQRNSQNMWISGSDNLTTVAALDFTTADVKPDNCVAVVSNQREPWVVKQETTEIYANTGAAAFPFQRVGFIERGGLATGSVVLVDGSVFWLGDDKRVYRSQGYLAVPVSTPSIDLLIANAYSPTTAEAFAYTQAGHTHYHITFADLTLAYDLTTGLWRERKSFGVDRWRGQCYSRIAADTHLVGDYVNGRIYELDLNAYGENGAVLEREIVLPPLSDEPAGHLIHELALDIEAGVGLTSGQGSASVWMVAWSDDDGRTWSNDREMSLGAIGEYRRRAKITRLGRSRNRSLRLRLTDPVKPVILGCRARLEALAA